MVCFLLDAITLLIFSPIFWRYLLHFSWYWGSNFISSLFTKDNNSIQMKREHLQMSFLKMGWFGTTNVKMLFSPSCHELWCIFLRQRSNCTMVIPRLDLRFNLIYHEHKWLSRKKMIIIHNFGLINIVDFKEHKLSQEWWLRNDNWKYNISVFSKVVKNKLKEILILIQDDFFCYTCLPLPRCNPTQQSLGVPLRKQWGRLYWLPPTWKHTPPTVMISYFWWPGKDWLVSASESMWFQ